MNNTMKLTRAVGGEFLCTFMFLSVVLAMAINSARTDSDGGMGNAVSGIVVGFVSVAIIYCFGDISGANLNPAVTFTAVVLGKRDFVSGTLYIIVQLLAGIIAALFQYVIFPKTVQGEVSIGYAMTIHKSPDASVFNAFMMEIYLTFILVYIVFACALDAPKSIQIIRSTNLVTSESENRKSEKRGDPEDPDDSEGEYSSPVGQESEQPIHPVSHNFAMVGTPGLNVHAVYPVIIGLTLGFLVYLGGSSSGGAFNIARVFGPSLVALDWEYHYIYWIGGLIGGLLGGITQKYLFSRYRDVLSFEATM